MSLTTSRHVRTLLKTPARHLRRACCAQPPQFRIPKSRFQHTSSQESSLPRIIQPSIWQSIIPRALRTRPEKPSQPAAEKPSNPANYFIWIYLLIGSQAIRILTVQNEFKTYMRRAELKLERLREVVEKLQRGEDVDVEKVLGTGDEIQEREWEEALKEIESEERLWQDNKRQRREERKRLAKEEADANPVNDSADKVVIPATENSSVPASTPQSPGFY